MCVRTEKAIYQDWVGSFLSQNCCSLHSPLWCCTSDSLCRADLERLQPLTRQDDQAVLIRTLMPSAPWACPLSIPWRGFAAPALRNSVRVIGRQLFFIFFPLLDYKYRFKNHSYSYDLFQRVILIRCSLFWNAFLLELLSGCSPVLLCLLFQSVCIPVPHLSPRSFLESKKQWVLTEPHILANDQPLPWHSARGRDWKDLPDCEMRDRGETPGPHGVRAWLSGN